jgi:hypothetical protein
MKEETMLRVSAGQRRGLLIVGVILLFATGCSNSEPEATFTGTTCDYKGPEAVKAGGVEVTFANSSGEFAALAFLKLPEDEAVRERELALIGTDNPIPDPPLEDGPQLTGFILAEPGEEILEEVPLPSGDYTVDCTTFEGDRPSHGWRAAVIEVEG